MLRIERCSVQTGKSRILCVALKRLLANRCTVLLHVQFGAERNSFISSDAWNNISNSCCFTSLRDKCYRVNGIEGNVILHQVYSSLHSFMGRMAIGWRRATEKLKRWTTTLMNLMIELGRSCWTARNGMIYGERQTSTLHNGKDKTTGRGESVFVCPERRGTGPNWEY